MNKLRNNGNILFWNNQTLSLTFKEWKRRRRAAKSRRLRRLFSLMLRFFTRSADLNCLRKFSSSLLEAVLSQIQCDTVNWDNNTTLSRREKDKNTKVKLNYNFNLGINQTWNIATQNKFIFQYKKIEWKLFFTSNFWAARLRKLGICWSHKMWHFIIENIFRIESSAGESSF